MRIIREKRSQPPLTKKELVPYYNLIIKNLPSRPTHENLEETYAKIIKIPKFRQSISESEKLNAARKLVEKTLEERAYFSSRQKSRVRAAIRRSILPPDEKEFLILQEKARRLMVKHSIQRALGRLKQMTKRTLKIKGKNKIRSRTETNF